MFLVLRKLSETERNQKQQMFKAEISVKSCSISAFSTVSIKIDRFLTKSVIVTTINKSI